MTNLFLLLVGRMYTLGPWGREATENTNQGLMGHSRRYIEDNNSESNVSGLDNVLGIF